jgi:hypothetical protein
MVIVSGVVTLTLRMTSSAVTGKSAELWMARCFSARRASAKPPAVPPSCTTARWQAMLASVHLLG